MVPSPPQVSAVATQLTSLYSGANVRVYSTPNTVSARASLMDVCWHEGPSRTALEREFRIRLHKSPGPIPPPLSKVSFNRSVSPENLARLCALLVFESGLPPVPEFLMELLLVEWCPPLPSPFDAQRLEAAVSHVLRGDVSPSAPLMWFLAALLDSAEETCLLQPLDLSMLSPSDRLTLDCFVTLCADAGARLPAEVVLYAASGGWALASALALPVGARGV